MVVVDFIEIILEVLLTWVSPDGVAKKVNNNNTSIPAKWTLIIIFTLIYLACLVGLVFSFFKISDILYKVFAVILSIFFLVSLFRFYFTVIKG